MKTKIIILLLALSSVLFSCKKFLDIDPPSTTLTSESVYKDNISAIGVLNGIYSSMALDGLFSGPQDGLSVKLGLSSDEFDLLHIVWNPQPSLIYRNELSSTVGPGFWTEIYKKVSALNIAIEGLTSSSSLSPVVKNQLLGEAKFTRAVYFFYLTNMFKDVPLPLTADYRLNDKLTSLSQDAVYTQVISDLKEAESLLSSRYLSNTLTSESEERVRPIKPAVEAFLARVYLYQKNWQKAEEYASKLIDNPLFEILPVNEVFLKNSKEAIWQLQPAPNFNTRDGEYFIIRDVPNFDHPLFLSKSLLDGFDKDHDERYANWINKVTDGTTSYFFPFKYKKTFEAGDVSEYVMVLRLAEQYLIRAEARAEIGNIGGAQEDLKVITERAGLDINASAEKNTLLSQILEQRRLELFSELGHRWFDLKRTGTIDAAMTSAMIIKGGVWESYKAYFPKMQSEILKNPNIKQTPGY